MDLLRSTTACTATGHTPASCGSTMKGSPVQTPGP